MNFGMLSNATEQRGQTLGGQAPPRVAAVAALSRATIVAKPVPQPIWMVNSTGSRLTMSKETQCLSGYFTHQPNRGGPNRSVRCFNIAARFLRTSISDFNKVNGMNESWVLTTCSVAKLHTIGFVSAYRARLINTAVMLAMVLATGGTANAGPGLSIAVYDGSALVPGYTGGAPTDAVVTSQINIMRGEQPTYTFIETSPSFLYGDGSGVPNTVAGFFGAAAAGTRAASDTTAANGGFFGFIATGFINVATAGSYTFSLPPRTNSTTSPGSDDAVRVLVDASTVAELNYVNGLSPHSTTETLSAGFHSFALYYFQTGGGSDIDYRATGPGGSTVSYTTTATGVPEPASLGLFSLALAGLSVTRRSSNKKRAASPKGAARFWFSR